MVLASSPTPQLPIFLLGTTASGKRRRERGIRKHRSTADVPSQPRYRLGSLGNVLVAARFAGPIRWRMTLAVQRLMRWILCIAVLLTAATTGLFAQSTV